MLLPVTVSAVSFAMSARCAIERAGRSAMRYRRLCPPVELHQRRGRREARVGAVARPGNERSERLEEIVGLPEARLGEPAILALETARLEQRPAERPERALETRARVRGQARQHRGERRATRPWIGPELPHERPASVRQPFELVAQLASLDERREDRLRAERDERALLVPQGVREVPQDPRLLAEDGAQRVDLIHGRALGDELAEDVAKDVRRDVVEVGRVLPARDQALDMRHGLGPYPVEGPDLLAELCEVAGGLRDAHAILAGARRRGRRCPAVGAWGPGALNWSIQQLFSVGDLHGIGPRLCPSGFSPIYVSVGSWPSLSVPPSRSTKPRGSRAAIDSATAR